MSRAYTEPCDLEPEKVLVEILMGSSGIEVFTDFMHGATAGVLLKCFEAGV